MSIGHSLRKKIIRGLTGINPNTESSHALFEDAKTIQDGLSSNPQKHKWFARFTTAIPVNFNIQEIIKTHEQNL